MTTTSNKKKNEDFDVLNFYIIFIELLLVILY
jgi:hypothetical protein